MGGSVREGPADLHEGPVALHRGPRGVREEHGLYGGELCTLLCEDVVGGPGSEHTG